MSQWIENEAKFVEHKWLVNKYFAFLLVLVNPNTVYLFQNDQLRETIRLDLNSVSMQMVLPSNREASEVDETFGFGNVLDAKIKEKLAPDEELDDEALLERLKNEGKGPEGNGLGSDFMISTFSTFKDGFVVAASSGLLSYFVIDNFERIRDMNKKITLSNPQNYKIKGFETGHEILYVSVNRKFTLTTLIVQTNIETDYYLLSDIDIKEDINKIEKFFPAGFHRSKVNNLTLSRAKSTFATAG